MRFDQTSHVNPYQVGDVITHVEGQKIDFAFGENYVTLVNQQRGLAKKYYEDNNLTQENINDVEKYNFTMTVSRDGQVQDLTIVVYPEFEKNAKDETVLNCYVGLESGKDETPCTKAYVYDAWSGFCRSFEMAFGFAWVVLKSLWMLITFQIPISEMGGTVATISTIATYASQSLSYLLVFIPLIAANLAVFNLLPIPALDGSHVLFTVIEWIRGKPINRKVESMIHFVGLCILFGFVIIVDILHFVL